MKTFTLWCVATFALIYTVGCNSGESTSNSGPDKSSLRNTPEPTRSVQANDNSAMTATSGTNSQNNFWMAAASGGMAEVELGRMAATKAQNAEVKQFGEMMVAEHTKSNDELKSLAVKKSVSLPPAPDAAHQATMTRMQGLNGAEFDKAYVEAMVADHEATVQLFESEAARSADAEARAFAEKTLPNLRRHLEMIRDIRTKLSAGAR